MLQQLGDHIPAAKDRARSCAARALAATDEVLKRDLLDRTAIGGPWARSPAHSAVTADAHQSSTGENACSWPNHESDSRQIDQRLFGQAPSGAVSSEFRPILRRGSARL